MEAHNFCFNPNDFKHTQIRLTLSQYFLILKAYAHFFKSHYILALLLF